MAPRRRAVTVSPALLAVATTFVAAGLVLGLVAGRGEFFSNPRPAASRVPKAPEPGRVSAPPTSAPGVVPKAAPARPRQPAALPEKVGRVAIIFDDAGGSLPDLEQIIAIGRPVTVAVLPGLRFSAAVAERAKSAGVEVILHLPVEADDVSKDVGAAGITISMSDAEIEERVEAALTAVPGAIGVNNHMGSKGTADERVMRAILRVVKEHNLLFVDSVTSTRTVAGRLAQEMGIRTASRQVFLDNVDEADAIRAQLRRVIQIARRRGDAVAIGHAHRLTAQVLQQMLGEFDRSGIQLVPISALTH
ncbi:MAG: divergent polysaccharide deacetylase family protein [bacterium]